MSAAKSGASRGKDLAALLAEAVQSDEFDFELKAQEVAVNLVSLMSHAGLTRAELARALNWPAGRVTKVLGGQENLTLRTMYLIYKALGYTFDVVPRTAAERVPMQPWQRFSFDTAHVVSTDIKLHERPKVARQTGHGRKSAWARWPSDTRKNSYKLDLIAANTDQYDATLAS